MEIEHEDGRIVNVSAFSDEYEPRTNIRVSTVAYLWEDPATGKQYILIVHEALYFGDKLEHSLLNPNQIRDNGITVKDVP